MIINLIGPPAVGKSTFASRFVLEHPYYKYCTIDAYRVDNYNNGLSELENNKVAWIRFWKDVYHAKDVVIESIGLDWRLKKIFQKLSDRPRLTIAFIGNAQTIISRLKDRQHKRPLPIKYNFQDEIDTVYYVLDELSKDKAEYDTGIYVTDLTPSEVYELVTPQITSFRIDHSG